MKKQGIIIGILFLFILANLIWFAKKVENESIGKLKPEPQKFTFDNPLEDSGAGWDKFQSSGWARIEQDGVDTVIIVPNLTPSNHLKNGAILMDGDKIKVNVNLDSIYIDNGLLK